MWRVRKTSPNCNNPTNDVLRRAIMFECGTDPATIRNNRKALIVLDWIRAVNKKRFRLTNKDLNSEA
jgi:hypothetical protein